MAGLDAGRAYNTFPLMNGQFIPAEYFNPATPGLRNAFENTAAVQLHHRTLALSTLASVTAFWVSTRALPLPPHARLLSNVLLAAAAGQARPLLSYPAPLHPAMLHLHCADTDVACLSTPETGLCRVYFFKSVLEV